MKLLIKDRFALFTIIFTFFVLIMALPLKLFACLLAGLFVYELVNALARPIERTLAKRNFARWTAVALLSIIIVIILGLAFTGLFSLVLHEINDPGQFLKRMMDLISHARDQLPDFIVNYLPSSVEDISNLLERWFSGHFSQLRTWGQDAVHLLLTVLIGMILGAIIALVPTPEIKQLKPLSAAFYERLKHFSEAFHRIVFAQIKISFINTILTAVFLLVFLPAAHVHFPFVKTVLLATFICGLLPVVGNLISNSLIFLIALSLSLWVALSALAYLILIHKLEYFLNARIIGGHIRARAWELLIAMLIFEAAFGFSGIIAAPIYYAYLKSELQDLSLI